MLTSKQKKNRLRRDLRAIRKRLSKDEHHSTSATISRILRNLDEYKQASTIGVYLATEEEVSLDPFIVQARKDGKKLFLPVISKTSGEKRMYLQQWTEEDELASNRYGIDEPINSSGATGTRASDERLDIILMPLLGYSVGGARLGQGAGYYDRYLEQIGDHSQTKRIGIAHSCQECEEIPQEEWDKKMHMLVNEKEVLKFLVQVTTETFY